MKILAFESSCDETSVAVVEDGQKVLSNVVKSQIDIFKLYGGVVPEIAARNHVLVITSAIEKALSDANCTKDDIDYVAVTQGPGLIGPLLIGIDAALAFAYSINKPVIGVNHLVGHAYAAQIEHEMKFPSIILLVSGGHTELLLAKGHLQFELIGQTYDDAVGEAYDKVARVLGQKYPGGPILDKLASQGDSNRYQLPRPVLDKDNFNFSFSGLKSAVINLYNKEVKNGNEIVIEDFAASFQKAVIDVLLTKTKLALEKYPDVKQLIVGGGVSANKGLRKALEEEIKGVELLIPKFSYCTDNAAMIGAAAYYYIKNGLVNKDYILKAYSINNL